jgi:hypothetical protein
MQGAGDAMEGLGWQWCWRDGEMATVDDPTGLPISWMRDAAAGT